MGFESFLQNELHRQHLNLSESAWDIIDSDMHMFRDMPQAATFSSFLNLIFLNYYERSPSNLSNAAHRYRETCRHAIVSSNACRRLSAADANKLLDALAKQHIDQLGEEFLRLPKGSGRKFRLNNKAFQLICGIPDNSYNCRIYERPGKLLKAIFETYCRLPFAEREKLIFSEQADLIKTAMQMKALLKIRTLGEQTYYFIPYKIMTDLSSNFYYAAGYSAAENSDEANSGHYIASSFRLSRMKDIQRVYGQSACLTPEQKKELEESISAKGVQFLLRDMVTAQVKLTDAGVKKYQTQLHLRPPYAQIHPGQVYEFHTTKEQLLYYFFKFGKDAAVLSPESLREEFRQMYQEAADSYRQPVIKEL